MYIHTMNLCRSTGFNPVVPVAVYICGWTQININRALRGNPLYRSIQILMCIMIEPDFCTSRYYLNKTKIIVNAVFVRINNLCRSVVICSKLDHRETLTEAPNSLLFIYLFFLNISYGIVSEWSGLTSFISSLELCTTDIQTI